MLERAGLASATPSRPREPEVPDVAPGPAKMRSLTRPAPDGEELTATVTVDDLDDISFDLGRGPRVELVKLAGLWHVHVGDEELAGACAGYRESLAVAARRLREEPDGEWATATLDALADASLAS